jgi:hypothetical protein
VFNSSCKESPGIQKESLGDSHPDIAAVLTQLYCCSSSDSRCSIVSIYLLFVEDHHAAATLISSREQQHVSAKRFVMLCVDSSLEL